MDDDDDILNNDLKEYEFSSNEEMLEKVNDSIRERELRVLLPSENEKQSNDGDESGVEVVNNSENEYHSEEEKFVHIDNDEENRKECEYVNEFGEINNDVKEFRSYLPCLDRTFKYEEIEKDRLFEFDIRNQEDDNQGQDVDQETIYCVSKDPRHDTTHLITNFERIIQIKKRFFKRNGRKLRNLVCWSDNHEASSTSFFYAMRVIRKMYNFENLVWSFTTSQHGKGLWDSEGCVFKRLVYLGVTNGHLVYARDHPWELSVINYIRNRFKRYKKKRTVLNGSYTPCSHLTRPKICKGMNYVKQYASYRVDYEGNLYRRYLPCFCFFCRNYDWDNCINFSVAGHWHKFDIELKKERLPKGYKRYDNFWKGDKHLYAYTMEKVKSFSDPHMSIKLKKLKFQKKIWKRKKRKRGRKREGKRRKIKEKRRREKEKKRKKRKRRTKKRDKDKENCEDLELHHELLQRL